MKQLKLQKLLAAACLTIMSLAACSEEETPQMPEEMPGIVLTEKIESDGGTVNRKEEFYYNEAGQLTKRVTKQVYTVVINGIKDVDSLRRESRVTYADGEAAVTDASGNTSTYLLNNDGYAHSCIRREVGTKMARLYTFGYSYDGQLTKLQEIINGEIVSQLTLQPQTETTASIHTAYNEIISTFQLTLGEANTSHLPWLYLTELYPLDLHQEALYGGLLGKSPARLIQTITPVTGNEQTTYTYTTDETGNLSSCTESLVSYGDTYRRTVGYSINLGKTSQTAARYQRV